MKILNRTPHPIHILDDQGNIIKTYEPSLDPPLRMELRTIPGIPLQDGTPTTMIVGNKVTGGLPQKKAHVYHIVSRVVKVNFPRRKDLLVAHNLVWDESGRVRGCKSLSY